MIYRELDVVRLVVDLPEYGLKTGNIGTIVSITPGVKGFLVEFLERPELEDHDNMISLMPEQVDLFRRSNA